MIDLLKWENKFFFYFMLFFQIQLKELSAMAILFVVALTMQSPVCLCGIIFNDLNFGLMFGGYGKTIWMENLIKKRTFTQPGLFRVLEIVI